jgi:hypothetical protein
MLLAVATRLSRHPGGTSSIVLPSVVVKRDGV